MLPRLSIHTFVSVEHLYNFPILPLFSVTTLCLTTPPSTNNQRRNVLTNFYVKQPKNKMPFDMSGKTISQLTQAHFEPYIKQATKTKDKNAAYDPVNQSQHPNQIYEPEVVGAANILYQPEVKQQYQPEPPNNQYPEPPNNQYPEPPNNQYPEPPNNQYPNIEPSVSELHTNPSQVLHSEPPASAFQVKLQVTPSKTGNNKPNEPFNPFSNSASQPAHNFQNVPSGPAHEASYPEPPNNQNPYPEPPVPVPEYPGAVPEVEPPVEPVPVPAMSKGAPKTVVSLSSSGLSSNNMAQSVAGAGAATVLEPVSEPVPKPVRPTTKPKPLTRAEKKRLRRLQKKKEREAKKKAREAAKKAKKLKEQQKRLARQKARNSRRKAPRTKTTRTSKTPRRRTRNRNPGKKV